MKQQRGFIDTSIVWVIVAILAVIAIGALDHAGMLGDTGVYVAVAVAVVAVGWLAWATGALPFLDTGMRAALAGRMAKRLNGTVSSYEHSVWGGKTALAYVVEWEGRQRRYRLEFDVSGTQLSARGPGAPARVATVSVNNGEFRCKGKGRAVAERLLDDNMRAALVSIDRLKGGDGDLSLHLSGDEIRIYKQQRLSASRTHQLVLLGMPVIERAIALLQEK